jgi:MYXO-CTERM domain-containing protein
MKTIRVFVLITFMSALMAVSMPASAQESPTSGQAREENYDDDDDRGNYGWIGLLGLFGLAGLARKNKDEVNNRSTTNRPQSKYAS